MKMFALALALMLPCLAAGPDSKSVGNPAAPMRMDLYSDFTCPHCKVLHEQTLPKIMADYVTPGKAYLVFHEFTLTGQGHEHSKTAMNFWPYPVDPRGLGITTTYPAAANTCAFQR